MKASKEWAKRMKWMVVIEWTGTAAALAFGAVLFSERVYKRWLQQRQQLGRALRVQFSDGFHLTS